MSIAEWYPQSFKEGPPLPQKFAVRWPWVKAPPEIIGEAPPVTIEPPIVEQPPVTPEPVPIPTPAPVPITVPPYTGQLPPVTPEPIPVSVLPEWSGLPRYEYRHKSFRYTSDINPQPQRSMALILEAKLKNTGEVPAVFAVDASIRLYNGVDDRFGARLAPWVPFDSETYAGILVDDGEPRVHTGVINPKEEVTVRFIRFVEVNHRDNVYDIPYLAMLNSLSVAKEQVRLISVYQPGGMLPGWHTGVLLDPMQTRF